MSLAMWQYSIKPKIRRVVKGYEFLSLARKYKKQLLGTGVDFLKMFWVFYVGFFNWVMFELSFIWIRMFGLSYAIPVRYAMSELSYTMSELSYTVLS